MDKTEQAKIAQEIVDGLKARGLSAVGGRDVLMTASGLAWDPITLEQCTMQVQTRFVPLDFEIGYQGNPIGTAAK